MKLADETASKPYDTIIGVYAGDRTQESSLWITTLLSAWDVYVSVYETVLTAQFGIPTKYSYLSDIVTRPNINPSIEYPKYEMSGCAVQFLYNTVGICPIDTSNSVSSSAACDAACMEAVKIAYGKGSPDSKLRLQVLEQAFGKSLDGRDGVWLYYA